MSENLCSKLFFGSYCWVSKRNCGWKWWKMCLVLLGKSYQKSITFFFTLVWRHLRIELDFWHFLTLSITTFNCFYSQLLFSQGFYVWTLQRGNSRSDWKCTVGKLPQKSAHAKKFWVVLLLLPTDHNVVDVGLFGQKSILPLS